MAPGVPVQRLDGSPLRDRGGLPKSAGPARNPWAFDQLLRPRRIADTPARHGIGLGDAVHGQRALVEIGLHLRGGDELEIVVDEMLVHVVSQHPDIADGGISTSGDHLHLVPAIGRAEGFEGEVEG